MHLFAWVFFLLLYAGHSFLSWAKNSPFCLQRSGLFLQSSPLFDGAGSGVKAVGGSRRKKTGGGVPEKDKSVIFAHLCVEKPFVSKKKTTFAVELSLNLLSTPPCKKDYFFSSWRCSLLWRRSRRRRSPSSVAGATSRGISSSLSTAAMSLRRVPTHRM